MAQKHNDCTEQPMTRMGTIQGPSRRYRRLRHPSFPAQLWTQKNPLLQRGEIGIEIDTHKAKIGDGTTYWNDLPYALVSEYNWGDIVGDITNQTDLIQYIASATDTYVHDQAEAATVWTINHNLGKHPSIDVVDTSGNVVSGTYTYVDENTMIAEFNAAFKGTAYLN